MANKSLIIAGKEIFVGSPSTGIRRANERVIV